MDIDYYQNQLEKALEYFNKNLQGLQAGRASPSLLENIDVDTSYGNMKINQLGHISVMDSHTLKVEVRDKSQMGNVHKSIYDADLGLSPQNEKEYILVPIPALTEDRRLDLVKKVKSMGEDSKTQIRQIRQDAMKKTKGLLADKAISEDESANDESSIENLVKEFNSKIDDLVSQKSDDVMAV